MLSISTWRTTNSALLFPQHLAGQRDDGGQLDADPPHAFRLLGACR
jgi:hypothetical protein